jgi:iron(III) transport system ATP-binding protein
MYLTLDRVSVRYRGATAGKPAVDNLTLSLSQGQIGVLIGPSGCGKTSVLRAVAGLERLASGRIALDGTTVALTPDAANPSEPPVHALPEQRAIGMVFQDYALFPHLSVAENVAFGIKHLSADARRTRVREMLALVELDHVGQRLPHALSGGQQQRVALARALARQPRLLLLDEPFSNLDVDLRERLAHEVRRILLATQTTALFVTHDQFEAFALGDVIGVMNQGQLEQWDAAYTLYHRPSTRFVAEFIGHGVFAPATIEQTPHGPVVNTPLGVLGDNEECPLPSAYEGGQCDVLLRADDVVHDDDSPVKAQVLRKAFRGSEFLYTLRLKQGQEVQALVPSHHDHAVGEWIGIRPAVDHVVTFARAFARERGG